MPQWVDDCVDSVKKKGVSEDRAWAICWAEYKKQQEKKGKALSDQEIEMMKEKAKDGKDM